MPARRELTLEEYDAREAGRREQWRQASLRYRQRQHDAKAVSMTRQHDGALSSAHTHEGADEGTPARSFPLVTSSPTEKRDTTTGGVGGGAGDDVLAEVLAVFAPFGVRGKTPTRRYLELLRGDCPHVAFQTAAIEAVDWLQRPENGERLCSSAFIGNWMRKREREAAAASTTGAAPVVETDPERAALRRLVEGGARSAVGRAVELYLEHPPEAPSTWRH